MENPNETTQRYNANEARIDPFRNLSERNSCKVQCSERNITLSSIAMRKKLGDKNKTYSEKMLLGICLIRVKGRFFLIPYRLRCSI